jgi:peptide/nickel transport system permease protein
MSTLANAASPAAESIRVAGYVSQRRRQWRAFSRNKLAVASLIVLVLIHLTALLAPWITGYDPAKVSPRDSLQGPSWDHLLGTDNYGRDVFTRLLYGGRVSLMVGLASVAVSMLVGTIVGALSGYFHGWPDAILMRFTDAMLAVPVFFLLLLVLTIFGGATTTIVLIIGLTSWMGIARLVRGEIMRFAEMEFVEAARSIGATPARVLVLHVLPHAYSAMIVSATIGIAYAILVESSLSYLGLGIQPPTATWGNMLQDAQQFLFNAPVLSVYPGLMIFFTVLAYNFLGDGLRDALDPRQSTR